MFVIQTSFTGIHGRPANQFYAGRSISGSGCALWVNLLAEAVTYQTRENAEERMAAISTRSAGHTYSVVPVSEALETGSIGVATINASGVLSAQAEGWNYIQEYTSVLAAIERGQAKRQNGLEVRIFEVGTGLYWLATR